MKEPETYHEMVVLISGRTPAEQRNWALWLEEALQESELWEIIQRDRGIRLETAVRMVAEVAHADDA